MISIRLQPTIVRHRALKRAHLGLQAGLPFCRGCRIRVSRQKGLGRCVTVRVWVTDNRVDQTTAVATAGGPWMNLQLGYAALRAPRVSTLPTCLMSTRPYRSGTPVLRKAQTLTRGDN